MNLLKLIYSVTGASLIALKQIGALALSEVVLGDNNADHNLDSNNLTVECPSQFTVQFIVEQSINPIDYLFNILRPIQNFAYGLDIGPGKVGLGIISFAGFGPRPTDHDHKVYLALGTKESVDMQSFLPVFQQMVIDNRVLYFQTYEKYRFGGSAAKATRTQLANLTQPRSRDVIIFVLTNIMGDAANTLKTYRKIQALHPDVLFLCVGYNKNGNNFMKKLCGVQNSYIAASFFDISLAFKRFNEDFCSVLNSAPPANERTKYPSRKTRAPITHKPSSTYPTRSLFPSKTPTTEQPTVPKTQCPPKKTQGPSTHT